MALRSISLNLVAGEVVGIVGPNGAGKSTLLRILDGTLRPQWGSVLFLGQALETMDRRTIAKSLAVVPQAPTVAYGFDVRSVVAMGRTPHQTSWSSLSLTDHEVVDAALHACALESLSHRPMQELSGGEQKRVTIARALAQTPRVLLLDEPGAFLDLRHHLALLELLVRKAQSDGLTSVLVSHDLALISQFTTRMVLLRKGEIIAQGPPAEVLTADTLRKAFDANFRVEWDPAHGTPIVTPLRS